MKIIKSFQYAFSGLFFCIKNERNFRIHITFAVTAAMLAYFYQLPPHQSVLLVFTIVFVFVTEMINTAIERVVDISTKEYDINAKIAKDVSAGAVLVSAICSVIIGVAVFFDVDKIAALYSTLILRIDYVLMIVIYAIICIVFIGKKNGKG